jgi:CHAT domain-containing protein
VREKEGDELELLRLQKSLEQNGEYYRLKYGDVSPGIRDLQQDMGSNQALVSLYAAGTVLHVFVVTRAGLTYTAIDSLADLQQAVEGWLDALKRTGNGHRFAGGAIGRRLYTRLVKPIQAAAVGKSEWIIVPDGLFALLPFESLYADEDGKQWLVETTTISYRWSSRLLRSGEGEENGSAVSGGVLAFAPFGSTGGDIFQRLPASGEEIAGLPGVQYRDGQATKARFLETINHYPMVHLATHAVSSMENPAASFIAFYPARHSAMDDRLYLEELYGLNLRATRLVIISACETGQGEVAPQEGVISLARAFAYAGCASSINSLWKADDQATSFILRRFYVHLQRGETKARALQLAKLDYIKSDAIDKSPAYWAHLVLTGDSGALYPKRHWALLVTLGLLLVSGAMGWMWRRGKKKSRRVGNAFGLR